MIYKDFQDLKLSALGMGCMRLPVVGGNDAVVDETAAEEMVDCAMANGPGQTSPGKILHCRQVPRLRPIQHAQGAGDF